MKIISLEVENVKCLKAISISPDGSTVVIGGENGNGKSSILDSIQYALGGSKDIPGKPIRDGQEKAKIVLDLGDMQVVRTFTKNGTNLVVKNKDGSTFASPQAMLDKLVGNLSFDPMEFSRMDDKKRLETLKKIVGLDFTELDKEHKASFDKRTDINRRGKELKAQFDAIEDYSDVPDKEVSVAELSIKFTDAVQENKRLSDSKTSLGNNKVKLERINEQMSQLLTEKTKIESYIEKEDALLKKLKEVDVSEIQKRINSAEETNKRIRGKQSKLKFAADLQKLRDESQSLTGRLEEINSNKKDLMENAKFPIKGLAFDENGVTYNDLPFDQSSQGERIKISVAMGLVLNPTLKILLIRDGSLLDEKNLEMVAKMAEKTGGQIWLERVGRGKECQIVIQDGSIVDN